jgi:hypothetical protein
MDDGPSTSRRGAGESRGRKRRHDDTDNRNQIKVEKDPEIEAIEERMLASTQIPPEERGVIVDSKTKEINEAITDMLEQIENVDNSSLKVFLEKEKLYEERHQRRLKSAELARDLQLKNVNDLYEFQVQEIEQMLEQDKDLLRSQLKGMLYDRIRKLEETRDGITDENRIATRKLRSKTRAHGDEPLSFPLPSTGRKKVHSIGFNVNLSKNNLALEENQIEDDLLAIYSDYKKNTSSFNAANAASNCDVRVENNVLYLKDITLKKGADIIVVDNLKGNKYSGNIISFASSEVNVLALW